MPSEPPANLRLRLAQARVSLFRAWYFLQVFRILLEEVGGAKIPAPTHERSIAEEGAVLVKALEDVLRTEHSRFDELQAAAEAIKPDLVGSDNGFANRRMRLMKAMDILFRADHWDRHKVLQRARDRIEMLGRQP